MENNNKLLKEMSFFFNASIADFEAKDYLSFWRRFQEFFTKKTNKFGDDIPFYEMLSKTEIKNNLEGVQFVLKLLSEEDRTKFKVGFIKAMDFIYQIFSLNKNKIKTEENVIAYAHMSFWFTTDRLKSFSPDFFYMIYYGILQKYGDMVTNFLTHILVCNFPLEYPDVFLEEKNAVFEEMFKHFFTFNFLYIKDFNFREEAKLFQQHFSFIDKKLFDYCFLSSEEGKETLINIIHRFNFNIGKFNIFLIYLRELIKNSFNNNGLEFLAYICERVPKIEESVNSLILGLFSLAVVENSEFRIELKMDNDLFERLTLSFNSSSVIDYLFITDNFLYQDRYNTNGFSLIKFEEQSALFIAEKFGFKTFLGLKVLLWAGFLRFTDEAIVYFELGDK